MNIKRKPELKDILKNMCMEVFMRCANCGSEINAGQERCFKCGAQLTAAAGQTPDGARTTAGGPDAGHKFGVDTILGRTFKIFAGSPGLFLMLGVFGGGGIIFKFILPENTGFALKTGQQLVDMLIVMLFYVITMLIAADKYDGEKAA